MKSIQQLREQRAAIGAEVKALLDGTEGKKWESADDDNYTAKMKQIDNVDAEIGRVEAYLKVAAEKALDGDADDLINKHVKTQGKHTIDSQAFRAYLTGGLKNLDADSMAILRSRQTADIQNAMSVGVGSEGGFTVATEFHRMLTEALKAYGGIRSVATIMQTSTGAAMSFPAADATAEEGEIVGENVAVTALDTTFSNLSLNVYKYSSKSIALPFELLQDSMFDLEAYIRELLAVRIGRITSKHFTTGTGTAQPNGIVTASTSGKVGTTGQTTNIIYDDLVDLEHSVDPMYRGRGAYMMNDASVKVLRKIKDSNGRPIFVPGYESNVPGGAPDTLLGRTIAVSQEMAVMAANAKSILFGDLSKYVIREVMDLTLFRMADSAFLLNGQIGFVGFNRQGGNLIDVGGAVKHYQNSAT